MKTPADLTKQERDLLGLFVKTEHNFQQMPHEEQPVFVNARLDVNLHEPGIMLNFTIWQQHGIVGGNEVFANRDKSHAFDLIWDLSSQDTFADNPDMIDRLLWTLDRIK